MARLGILFLNFQRILLDLKRSGSFSSFLISSGLAAFWFFLISLFVLSNYKSIFPVHFLILIGYWGVLFFLRKFWDVLKIQFLHRLLVIGLVAYYPFRIFCDTLNVSFLIYPQNIFEIVAVSYFFMSTVLWLQKAGNFFEKKYQEILFIVIFTPLVVFLLSPPEPIQPDLLWQGKYGFMINFEGAVSLDQGIKQLDEEFKNFP